MANDQIAQNQITKSLIASRLRQAGEMLKLRGESPYRARAYELGADAVEGLIEDLALLVEENRLIQVRGIGPSLATTISDLARTGHSATLDQIMGELPPGLLEMGRVSGLTLRRIQQLHETLGISDLEDLRQALAGRSIESVKGFGPQTAARLRKALERMQTAPSRVLLVEAREWARRLLEHLRALPEVVEAAVVGSIRRWVETVGDINLLAASDRPEPVRRAFAAGAGVARVVRSDDRSCELRLTNGIAVTLSVEPPGRFAGALLRSTGSQGHWDRLNLRARSRGLDLEQTSFPDEAAVYTALGLPFIPPELREDAGEIEDAEAGETFHDLLTEGDIRGMVHCHTRYSDGHNTVAEMATAARDLGMEYITITDHSPTASYAGGVKPERLPEQWREIAEAQSQVGIRILRGAESDILKDGGLDYSPEILGSLEVVIASIHDRYRMDAASMTARLVSAMHQPFFKIWGHALGRLLLKREPIACDLGQVLDAVAASRSAIELNGSPHRMDLPSDGVREARRRGIKFVVSTDAHSTAELANLTFGVALARRAGLRRSDVLNTLPVADFAERVRPAGPTPNAP